MDDVLVYSLADGERMFPNQVNHLATGGDPAALPAGDPESLPAAPDFIPVGLGGGGNMSVRMDITYTGGMPELNSVSEGIAALQSGAGLPGE